MTVAPQPDSASSSTAAPGDTTARTFSPESIQRDPRAVIAEAIEGYQPAAEPAEIAADVFTGLTSAGYDVVPRDEAARLTVRWEAEAADASRYSEQHQQLRQAVLDLARQWETAPWTRRMDYAKEYAAELRSLVDGAGQ